MNKIIIGSALLLTSSIFAGNLATPSAPIPGSRMSVGMSYDVNSFNIYGITDVTSMVHTTMATVSYAPLQAINIGLDVGMSKVDIYSPRELEDFSGDFGFAFGGNGKLSTPYFSDLVSLIAIAKGTYFYSAEASNVDEVDSDETKVDDKSYYRGVDFTAGGGLSFHINSVGYITVGAKYNEIMGKNASKKGETLKPWSNNETIGGWLAFDYFPKSEIISAYIPYMTVELAVYPGVAYSETASIENISLSVAFGAITDRLYGKKSELPWHP